MQIIEAKIFNFWWGKFYSSYLHLKAFKLNFGLGKFDYKRRSEALKLQKSFKSVLSHKKLFESFHIIKF